jgi:uncharacterized protein with WD repeat
MRLSGAGRMILASIFSSANAALVEWSPGGSG